MCIRCKHESWAEPDELHLCAYCVTLTRIEFERGFVRLQAYLAKWASFEDWVSAHAAAR